MRRLCQVLGVPHLQVQLPWTEAALPERGQ